MKEYTALSATLIPALRSANHHRMAAQLERLDAKLDWALEDSREDYMPHLVRLRRCESEALATLAMP